MAGFKLIEGFKEYASSKKKDNKLLQLLMILLALRLIIIYLVATYLWPIVMPKISSSIKSKPGFVPILGLVMIVGILF